MIRHPLISPNQRQSDENIDLTALIDVLFTLLIFLILTMGATQISTEISLSHSQEKLPNKLQHIQPIVVEVSGTEHLWKIENRSFDTFSRFKVEFLAQYKSQPDRPILLALEHSLPVDSLVRLMNFLSVNGFSNIQIISEWAP
ncbi:MAG: hypothetical protein GY866_37500 [Proteobacteria bacterium]|nr:hypothetical protein [Pseudomonadota bacterium]